jgi:predicted membrane channel-forming protein YqfA (hemolysin III family)
LEVKVGRHGSPWSFFLCVFVVKLVWSVLMANCRRILSTSLYANSIIGVGVGSTVYPVSCGEARKYTRWGDYAMIAASTLVFTLLFRPKKTGC